MRRVALIAVLVAPYLLWAVCVMNGAATDDKEIVAPPRLSETGLYDATGAIDARNLPFVPQYPLWTDGAEKLRWIRLPAGAKIDASDVDAWRFPVGTKLWKQFSWKGRKVETRMIWKTGEADWLFATYVWSEDQTNAMLAPETGIAN